MIPLVTLEGRHVRLEPIAHVHLNDLAEVAAEKELWRFMLSGDYSEREVLAKMIEKLSREPAIGSGMTFAQIDLAANRAVGATSYLDVSLFDRRLEIGRTWIGERARRTAINTEAKLLLMKHAFETLDMLRVQLKTDGRNLRSQRAIERLGAVKEGTLRQQARMPDGFQRDTVFYSVVASEWPAVKARLEGFLAR